MVVPSMPLPGRLPVRDGIPSFHMISEWFFMVEFKPFNSFPINIGIEALLQNSWFRGSAELRSGTQMIRAGKPEARITTC